MLLFTLTIRLLYSTQVAWIIFCEQLPNYWMPLLIFLKLWTNVFAFLVIKKYPARKYLLVSRNWTAKTSLLVFIVRKRL